MQDLNQCDMYMETAKIKPPKFLFGENRRLIDE